MGRPLEKDVLGTQVLRSYATGEAGIRASGYFAADGGTLRTDYQLVKQRGAKSFVVVRLASEEFIESESQSDLTSTNLRVGTLVVGTPAAEGEIQILGSNNGQIPGTVAIAKLTKRIATDFSGNRYTWYLENDSSADVIVLTAI
jgi:hypothetical protein